MMETVKLHGLAVPYNKQNSHGETIMPGCFEQSIAMFKQLGYLPMCGGHNIQVGAWTELDDRKDGLYVTGAVIFPEIVKKLRHMQEHRAMLHKHISKTITAFADCVGKDSAPFLPGLLDTTDPISELSICYAIKGENPNEREKRYDPDKDEYRPVIYKPSNGQLLLKECSLVEKGSFPDTYCNIVE